MREIRLSGSEGGVAGVIAGHPYPYYVEPGVLTPGPGRREAAPEFCDSLVRERYQESPSSARTPFREKWDMHPGYLRSSAITATSPLQQDSSANQA